MIDRQLMPVGDGMVEVLRRGEGPHYFVSGSPFQYSEDPASRPDALSAIRRSVEVAARGLGGSRENDAAKLGPVQLVRDMEAVRETLGIERWIATGASAGGWIALAYAIEHPSSVSGLVLSCTSADPEIGSDSIYHPEHPDHAGIMEAYAEGRTRDAFAMIAHRPHLIPEGRSTFSASHQAAFDEEFPTLRVAERLGEISVPTLVIVGRHDRAIPPAYGRLLAERIAGAQLVEFEESGHFPSLEEPDRFRATVADFCSGPVRAAFPGGA